MKFPKSKKDRYVFTCLANSQIRRTDPLSGTSIDEHWEPFSVQLDTKKIDSWSYNFKKPKRKNKDHLKKVYLRFLKTEVFQMIFCLAPLKGRSPRRSPLCVFGGWTGVFHSAGCQWSDIDSLLAPPLISFFLVLTSMRNVAKKRLYQFFGVVILR